MDKLSMMRTGCALAVTLALVNSLCAAVAAVWPVQAIAFANAWMHGLDLQLIGTDSPLSLVRLVYGVVGISITGFVIGVAYAWLYNWIPGTRRNAG